MKFTHFFVTLKHRGYQVTRAENIEGCSTPHWYAEVWVLEGKRPGHYRLLREGKTKATVIKMAQDGKDYQ